MGRTTTNLNGNGYSNTNLSNVVFTNNPNNPNNVNTFLNPNFNGRLGHTVDGYNDGYHTWNHLDGYNGNPFDGYNVNRFVGRSPTDGSTGMEWYLPQNQSMVPYRFHTNTVNQFGNRFTRFANSSNNPYQYGNFNGQYVGGQFGNGQFGNPNNRLARRRIF